MRGDAREHLLLRLEVAEHRIAERRVPVVDREARAPAAGLHAWDAEAHEPARVRHWQRLQQHLIEQGEDCRRRADPEREHHDHGRGQPGAQDDLAEGVFELVHALAPGRGTAV